MIAPFLAQRLEQIAPKFWISALLALLFNIGGIAAFALWGRALLSTLSAINLLIMAILVLINHEPISKKFIAVFMGVILIGFSAEIVGVNTGIIFGNYTYSSVLGLSLFGVPFIIGINWAMVVLGAYTLSQLIVSSKFWPYHLNKSIVSITLAAGLATLFDYLLEPVAMHLNFWQWEGNSIPLLNYISWFVVSFIAIVVLNKTKTEENKLAAIVLSAQSIFLVGITLMIRW
ncbi:carotenoid biosynthesis protein [Chryseotalea sanaruensis]|uniref:Carotenoid biosynthesis protein n=2 Tax=Chryseotalea sanaruensis TaxID=2482724 RepID=A0A401UDS4_9BACT|nr:carotenoid biosynthesis protein [Chryseotalea sanaruensis]